MGPVELSDAADAIKELTDGMPGPYEGSERLPESDAELRAAIALLERAVPLLEQADERETPRYDTWCTQHEWVEQARGTPQ